MNDEALSREELVERARALRTVLHVAHVLAEARDAGDLSARFSDAVAAYTRFASIAVFRLRGGRFEMTGQHGFPMDRMPAVAWSLPMRGSLTGYAAERREIVTLDDLTTDDRVEPSVRAALAHTGYVSAASVPLVHHGEVLGAFNLLYPAGATLRPAERSLLEGLGETLSVAMAQQLAAEREKELEAHAHRAQQLESLGVLAAGIAHDFNNLLVGILGAVELARRDTAKAGLAETRSLLDEALKAAERAATLTRQLLTFSRGGAPSRKLVDDLERVIAEAATFASRGTSVRCDVEIPAPLGAIEVDAGQIAQVVQNLVLNACQASPSGGVVTVRAARSSGTVRVEVIDRGRGIPEAQLGHVFEPFFTLREGGTGLGLAVSHSIIRRHGGTLSVASREGEGSTFSFELPAPELAAPGPAQQRAQPERFEGRVLVMDDDAVVRAIASRMLASLGFEVDEAPDGKHALELAVGRAYRLAVLDLTIVGGLGAREIVDELRRAAPETRIVLSSGYAHERAGGGWDATLTKPYRLDEMRRAVAEALR